MKTVYRSTFQDDALVLASILKSAGIEAETFADRMLDVNPLFSTDINGVSIVVPDEQEQDARAIVDDYKNNKSVPNLKA
ncbi:MAG: DUF2007 domain-containing protein [Spirochaetia bacterium]|nr:DUF2007 domain-containing protein [Spirochaetia bacterium]